MIPTGHQHQQVEGEERQLLMHGRLCMQYANVGMQAVRVPAPGGAEVVTACLAVQEVWEDMTAQDKQSPGL